MARVISLTDWYATIAYRDHSRRELCLKVIGESDSSGQDCEVRVVIRKSSTLFTGAWEKGLDEFRLVGEPSLDRAEIANVPDEFKTAFSQGIPPDWASLLKETVSRSSPFLSTLPPHPSSPIASTSKLPLPSSLPLKEDSLPFTFFDLGTGYRLRGGGNEIGSISELAEKIRDRKGKQRARDQDEESDPPMTRDGEYVKERKLELEREKKERMEREKELETPREADPPSETERRDEDAEMVGPEETIAVKDLPNPLSDPPPNENHESPPLLPVAADPHLKSTSPRKSPTPDPPPAPASSSLSHSKPPSSHLDSSTQIAISALVSAFFKRGLPTLTTTEGPYVSFIKDITEPVREVLETISTRIDLVVPERHRRRRIKRPAKQFELVVEPAGGGSKAAITETAHPQQACRIEETKTAETLPRSEESPASELVSAPVLFDQNGDEDVEMAIVEPEKDEEEEEVPTIEAKSAIETKEIEEEEATSARSEPVVEEQVQVTIGGSEQEEDIPLAGEGEGEGEMQKPEQPVEEKGTTPALDGETAKENGDLTLHSPEVEAEDASRNEGEMNELEGADGFGTLKESTVVEAEEQAGTSERADVDGSEEETEGMVVVEESQTEIKEEESNDSAPQIAQDIEMEQVNPTAADEDASDEAEESEEKDEEFDEEDSKFFIKLSPRVTGQFDEVVPLKLDSSSPPPRLSSPPPPALNSDEEADKGPFVPATTTLPSPPDSSSPRSTPELALPRTPSFSDFYEASDSENSIDTAAQEVAQFVQREIGHSSDGFEEVISPSKKRPSKTIKPPEAVVEEEQKEENGQTASITNGNGHDAFTPATSGAPALEQEPASPRGVELRHGTALARSPTPTSALVQDNAQQPSPARDLSLSPGPAAVHETLPADSEQSEPVSTKEVLQVALEASQSPALVKPSPVALSTSENGDTSTIPVATQPIEVESQPLSKPSTLESESRPSPSGLRSPVLQAGPEAPSNPEDVQEGFERSSNGVLSAPPLDQSAVAGESVEEHQIVSPELSPGAVEEKEVTQQDEGEAGDRLEQIPAEIDAEESLTEFEQKEEVQVDPQLLIAQICGYVEEEVEVPIPNQEEEEAEEEEGDRPFEITEPTSTVEEENDEPESELEMNDSLEVIVERLNAGVVEPTPEQEEDEQESRAEELISEETPKVEIDEETPAQTVTTVEEAESSGQIGETREKSVEFETGEVVTRGKSVENSPPVLDAPSPPAVLPASTSQPRLETLAKSSSQASTSSFTSQATEAALQALRNEPTTPELPRVEEDYSPTFDQQDSGGGFDEDERLPFFDPAGIEPSTLSVEEDVEPNGDQVPTNESPLEIVESPAKTLPVEKPVESIPVEKPVEYARRTKPSVSRRPPSRSTFVGVEIIVKPRRPRRQVSLPRTLSLSSQEPPIAVPRLPSPSASPNPAAERSPSLYGDAFEKEEKEKPSTSKPLTTTPLGSPRRSRSPSAPVQGGNVSSSSEIRSPPPKRRKAGRRKKRTGDESKVVESESKGEPRIAAEEEEKEAVEVRRTAKGKGKARSFELNEDGISLSPEVERRQGRKRPAPVAEDEGEPVKSRKIPKTRDTPPTSKQDRRVSTDSGHGTATPEIESIPSASSSKPRSSKLEATSRKPVQSSSSRHQQVANDSPKLAPDHSASTKKPRRESKGGVEKDKVSKVGSKRARDPDQEAEEPVQKKKRSPSKAKKVEKVVVHPEIEHDEEEEPVKSKRSSAKTSKNKPDEEEEETPRSPSPLDEDSASEPEVSSPASTPKQGGSKATAAPKKRRKRKSIVMPRTKKRPSTTPKKTVVAAESTERLSRASNVKKQRKKEAGAKKSASPEKKRRKSFQASESEDGEDEEYRGE